jgi:hypothetical protein
MGMFDKNTMVSRDKWRDFGVDIYIFMVEELQALGFETVMILGYEGTGKSAGLRKLEPETNIWYNCDKKNPTFKSIEFEGEVFNAKEVYGTKNNPTKFMKIPITYQEITDHLKMLNSKGALAEDRVAFILGHIEDYKTTDGEIRQKLKILGNLASKMNIEGSLENCLYTKVNRMGDKVEYKLDTQNSGSNTGRSLLGAFTDRYIDNDYNLIYNAITNY